MKKGEAHSTEPMATARRHCFEYKEFVLDYLTFGSGNETILCFHGFGRRAEDFEVFAPLLRPEQQLISINLFAHESSVFPEQRIDTKPLTAEEWKELLEAFLMSMSVEAFHMIGYSMGGRIAMKTLELMPDRVKSVLLIAPDGLKINLIYRFASGTALGKALYKRLINHPKPLFFVADTLHRFKLLNHKLHRFVHVHQNTRAKRQQVYDAWLIYKNMFPDLKKVADIVRYGKKFDMIFGTYDSIITPRLGKKMSGLIGSSSHYHEVEAGHQLMNELTRDFILSQGLWPQELKH